jgi:putative membrane protein
MEWRNLYRGVLMGISDLIPGVSGGTIAVVLGIYDQFLAAISGLFSWEFARHLRFLVPLGIGMGTAILGLSRVIQYFLDNHIVPTQFFFLGLIIGVLPILVKRSDARNNFTAKHMIVLVIAAILVGSMAIFNPDESSDPMTTLTFAIGLQLFFSGWIASMAMILPGISGSFILLLIGAYPTAIEALSTLNLPVIAVIGAGVVVGVVVSSKAITYLLASYPHTMYALIMGLIAGSVFVVYPGLAGTLTMLVSALTFVAGFGITVILGLRGQSENAAERAIQA